MRWLSGLRRLSPEQSSHSIEIERGPQLQADLGQTPGRVTTRSKFPDGETLLRGNTNEAGTRYGVGQKFSLKFLSDARLLLLVQSARTLPSVLCISHKQTGRQSPGNQSFGNGRDRAMIVDRYHPRIHLVLRRMLPIRRANQSRCKRVSVRRCVRGCARSCDRSFVPNSVRRCIRRCEPHGEPHAETACRPVMLFLIFSASTD